MTSKYIWAGIAMGTFFAGLGIGYAIYLNTYSPTMMFQNPQMWDQLMVRSPEGMRQWMNTMLTDPQMSSYMMGQMYQNPRFMQQMMSNPQHMQLMNEYMGQNATFMHGAMSSMMNNPSVSQQMMGEMMQNQQFMQSMMQNQQFQNQWMKPWWMQHNFTAPGMMGGR